MTYEWLAACGKKESEEREAAFIQSEKDKASHFARDHTRCQVISSMQVKRMTAIQRMEPKRTNIMILPDAYGKHAYDTEELIYL
jgi:hypothetical protein